MYLMPVRPKAESLLSRARLRRRQSAQGIQDIPKATTVVATFTGLLLSANGCWMLMTPLDWFAATPIAWRTGFPNAHFIRDVGWTYAAVGSLLIYGSAERRARTPLLLCALIWLVGHAAIHVGEVATGICSARQFSAEIPQVIGPTIFVAIALGLDVVDRRRDAL
jgi:hypothetical protein